MGMILWVLHLAAKLVQKEKRLFIVLMYPIAEGATKNWRRNPFSNAQIHTSAMEDCCYPSRGLISRIRIELLKIKNGIKLLMSAKKDGLTAGLLFYTLSKTNPYVQNLAKTNKVILPSFSKQQMDLTSQMANGNHWLPLLCYNP
jgi:hypothetical protein